MDGDEAQRSRVTDHFPFPQRGRVLFPVLAAGQFCHAVRTGPRVLIRTWQTFTCVTCWNWRGQVVVAVWGSLAGEGFGGGGV